MCIDSTDIAMSDYFLVWLELGRTAKNSTKQKRQLDGGALISLVMMLLQKSIVKHYKQRLRPFQRELVRMEEGGMRGNELVEGVLQTHTHKHTY